MLQPGQGAAHTAGGPCSPAPLTPPSLEMLGCPSGVWALMPVRPGAATAPCASPIAGQIQRTGNYTIVSILLTLGLLFLHILYRDLRRDWRTNFDFGWLAAARFMTEGAFFGDGFFLATLMTLGAISGLASVETTFHASDFDAF